MRIVVPDGIRPGFYRQGRMFGVRFAIGLFAHALQCDQRWIFLFRIGKRSFGYRTHGDATPDILTYYDAGWHWPWAPRPVSGKW